MKAFSLLSGAATASMMMLMTGGGAAAPVAVTCPSGLTAELLGNTDKLRDLASSSIRLTVKNADKSVSASDAYGTFTLAPGLFATNVTNEMDAPIPFTSVTEVGGSNVVTVPLGTLAPRALVRIRLTFTIGDTCLTPDYPVTNFQGSAYLTPQKQCLATAPTFSVGASSSSSGSSGSSSSSSSSSSNSNHCRYEHRA